MPEPAVAVLIVTYNSAADLPGCLGAVAALRHRPLELVIVDCGSEDGSASVAAEAAGELGDIGVTIEALGENRGFSGGMNEALRLCEAPFVLALNADARPDADFVERLLARLEDDERAAAATGRLVRPVDEAGVRRLDACGMYLRPAWRHFDRASGEIDRGQLMRAELVFGATGAATLYRRRALVDVAFDDGERGGGEIFDELFHSYREDAELCFRFQERGWRVVYEPAAIAEHRRHVLPQNRRSLPPAINYHSLKNRYLLRAYHQTAGNFLRTLVPALARDLAALLYVLLVERNSMAAYAWLWRHRRRILRRRRSIQHRRSEPPAAVERWFRESSRPLEKNTQPHGT